MKKLNLNLFKFIIFVFFIFSNSAFSETKLISYNASKIKVTDGDSLRFGKEKIRLFGIDAPELKQICNDKLSFWKWFIFSIFSDFLSPEKRFQWICYFRFPHR